MKMMGMTLRPGCARLPRGAFLQHSPCSWRVRGTYCPVDEPC